jgi:hypothetical protein
MDLPPELKNVAVFHVGLDYDQYYDIMAGMDVCVPAFGPSSVYYTLQESSTLAMCIQTNVSYISPANGIAAYIKRGWYRFQSS